MSRKPRLTDESFLEHIFHPKKAQAPSGLRKTHLSATTDRSKARLRSFNRMSAVNQELLKRAGKREDYLRGNTTIAEAKRSLRETAVSLGVAKPVRQRQTLKPSALKRRDNFQALLAAHIARTVREAGRNVNPVAIYIASDYYDDAGVPDSALRWGYPQIKYAARRGSEYEIMVQGQVRNPLWYK